MSLQKAKKIELLAPARDAEIAIAAINHGADAVYMGSPAFGARAQAANSLADIERVARYAHRFGARLYVTVNTIIYDRELSQAQALIWDLWRAGVDALIVQDLAVTRMNLPPIALHASTQCDIRTPQKARFLEQCGFTRLVLARELPIDEIHEIHEAVSADLEIFVHGALCVSYSGDCQASFALTGRSANRGECCQVCRFKFDLEDSSGTTIIKGKHLLSLRDMNRLNFLDELLEAGATSLKIEGRLKDAEYVKNVVGAYSRKLDSIIAANPGIYRRASSGCSRLTFTPDPSAGFNRGFTDYFLRNPQPLKGTMATFDSPKWTGKPVATVIKNYGKYIVVKSAVQLSNGDGLGYYTPSGEFVGFRANRIAGNQVFPHGDINLAPGTLLYRNSDKLRRDMLSGTTAERRIDVDVELTFRNSQLCLILTDEDGNFATVAEEVSCETARSPQTERRLKELTKFGDTIFNVRKVTDTCADAFIPASVLSRLRRRATEMLEVSREANRQQEKPKATASQISLPSDYTVTRHDNIANATSAGFYASLSNMKADELPRAIEVAGEKAERSDGGTQVMKTRYCLRRELGYCLKTPQGRDLSSPLFLSSDAHRFRLDFDCTNCRMSVIHLPNS